MYNSSAAYKFNNGYGNRANVYLTNDILDASPQKLLIKIYDFAIAQCRNENIGKTNEALMLLINSLRYDTPESAEISNGLRQLYEFSQDQMRKRNYEIVVKILTELRETWEGVFSS